MMMVTCLLKDHSTTKYIYLPKNYPNAKNLENIFLTRAIVVSHMYGELLIKPKITHGKIMESMVLHGKWKSEKRNVKELCKSLTTTKVIFGWMSFVPTKKKTKI